MSGPSASQSTNTTKTATDDTASGQTPTQEQQKKQQLPLEEDDEFEDFPVEGAFAIQYQNTARRVTRGTRFQNGMLETFGVLAFGGPLQLRAGLQIQETTRNADVLLVDWPDSETTLPEGNQHLWEESWDDDDTSEDFAVQLKEELKKIDQNGKR